MSVIYPFLSLLTQLGSGSSFLNPWSMDLDEIRAGPARRKHTFSAKLFLNFFCNICVVYIVYDIYYNYLTFKIMENTTEIIDFIETKEVENICNDLEANILKVAREQERCLMNLMESLERRRIKRQESKDLWLYRSKLIGMMDIMEVCQIDCSEFKWIYNI